MKSTPNPEPSASLHEHPEYESLLEKIRRVFGGELGTLTPTQEDILNGLILDRVKARGGDPGAVTLEEIEGCRELLYMEFSMAGLR